MKEGRDINRIRQLYYRSGKKVSRISGSGSDVIFESVLGSCEVFEIEVEYFVLDIYHFTVTKSGGM